MCLRFSSGPLASLPTHRSALLALAAACALGLAAPRAMAAEDQGSSETQDTTSEDVSVTFSAQADRLPLGWSAVPAPGQPHLPPEAWALPEDSVEPVTGDFLPGIYDVTAIVTKGPREGETYSARITIAPNGPKSFVIPRQKAKSK